MFPHIRSSISASNAKSGTHGLFDKPIEGRFDVVNIFDRIYELRSGSGIGVFAPQFGPRRGYYAGLSQQL